MPLLPVPLGRRIQTVFQIVGFVLVVALFAGGKTGFAPAAHGDKGPVEVQPAGELGPDQAFAPAYVIPGLSSLRAGDKGIAADGPPTEPSGDPTPSPSISWELELVAHDLQEPVFVTHAGDGSGRLFVVEKAGVVRALPGSEVFLDLRDRVLATGVEQGLLGLAFHPRFRETRLLYVSYTDMSGGLVVSRFRAGVDDGLVDPGSENVLFWQEQPASNHNGGMLAFGPDNFLYIGLGDGGGADDEFGNAQNGQTLLGALLRIDVDTGEPYAIPPDNPFVHDDTVLSEIWAYGLRNPWRFSFDRATHDLYLADVGQNRYEGVYVIPPASAPGTNFGWPILEGAHCLAASECGMAKLRLPVVEYDHSQGCAITGGYVYRGTRFPEVDGTYVFGDYCSGRIWTLSAAPRGQWDMSEVLHTETLISSFGEDEAGELYVTDFASGSVYQLVAQLQ